MHMGDAVMIALGLIGHAWIGRIQGPPAVVNGVAWVCAVIATVLIGRRAL